MTDFLWHYLKASPVIYAIAAFTVSQLYRRELKDYYSDLSLQGPQWLMLLTLGFALNWLWSLAVHIVGLSAGVNLADRFGILDNYITFILVNALFVYSLMYAHQLIETKAKPKATAPAEPSAKAIEKIRWGMEHEHLYLKQNLNIEEFAKKNGIHYREVSVLGARATGTGFLDDYAFLIAGLLDLHEATFESRWLERAIALQGTQDAHIADDAGGGYFATPGDHEALLAREKPDYDGAEPSGNAVALQNLLRLHSLTTDDAYRARADALLRAFGRGLQRRPSAMARLLVGLDYRLDRAKEIIIVTPATRDAAAPLLQQLRETFVPNHVLVVVPAGAEQDAVARRIPLVADKIVTNGKPTAYVCEERVCELPTTDPAVFSRQIARVEPFE
jgi:hypothetical protein